MKKEEKHKICVGVVFNAYKEIPRYSREVISEKDNEHTAHEVMTAVSELGHSCDLFSLGENIGEFLDWLELVKPDTIINLCEGYRGIPQLEANVAAIFELIGMAFTGNSSKVLALCQDKHKTKSVLETFGLPTPRYSLATSVDMVNGLKFPMIIKPNREDASLGIREDAVVHNQEELQRRIAYVINTYEQPALAEEYIAGREFNVAVFENSGLKALPVSEIDFSGMPEDTPNICSYEAKWIEDHVFFINSPPRCPAPIDKQLSKMLQRAALDAFRAMDCRDYARIDFRMAEDGTIYILEVNPNPDISLSAGYANALASAGIEYKEFWRCMIENALRRNTRDSQDECSG